MYEIDINFNFLMKNLRIDAAGTRVVSSIVESIIIAIGNDRARGRSEKN